jgi:GT2 family glycosyltransferase
VTDLSVCVPVYRAHHAPNLTTVRAGLEAALDGLDGELVVALNGLPAGAAGLGPDTRVVDLGVNRGVAPGWNAAASVAGGDVLVFTNDDVVLGPRSLAALYHALRGQSDAGAVGPVGTHWDLSTGQHRSWVDLSDRRDGELESCDVLAGFLFATTREVFDRVGGFDEAYAPCSFEEVDFCTAVRLRLGLSCYAVAGVDVEHEWGISRRSPPWKRVSFEGHAETLRSIHRRNRRHFLEKWSDLATRR